MNNRIDINTSWVSKNKATIRFPGDHKTDGMKAAAVLEAFLIDAGLDPKTDFKATYPSYDPITIEINGAANVILAINLLLSKKHIFSISYSSYGNDPYAQWSRILSEYLIAALENPKTTRHEMEKLNTLTKDLLDSAYQLLLKEPVATDLENKTINEQINGQLLKHPFYQLLSLIMDDFNARHSQFSNKGFFEKLGAKKPDKKEYAELYRKYACFIPACYCITETRYNYVEKKGIDSTKLAAAKKIENASVALQKKAESSSSAPAYKQ